MKAIRIEKQKKLRTKKLAIKIIGATVALGATIGVSISFSFASTIPLYVDFDNPSKTFSYYDPSMVQGNQWNVPNVDPTNPTNIKKFPQSGDDNQASSELKFKYAAEVIDGASHQVLDHSFNQDAYRGLDQ